MCWRARLDQAVSTHLGSLRSAQFGSTVGSTDLPAEIVVRVPRNDTALSVQLHDFTADRDALFFGAVPVGVVEEGLDPAGLLSVAIACSLRSAFRVAITGPDLAAA
jgi:hypothetical protein